MAFKPIVCDIYKGSEFYNSDKNIIRISIIFDDTDVRDRVYDVPLMSAGIFKNPDFRYHKVLAFLPDDITKKVAIENPENVKVGDSEIIVPLGVLIDSMQYKKLIGSIGNTGFHNNSNVGNQEIEDLDFFIPAGVRKTNMLGNANTKAFKDKDGNITEIPLDDEEEQMLTCGIGGAKDGSIILRGPTGEIVIGSDGMRLTGKLTIADGTTEKSDLFTDNWLNMLPQTIVTPFPGRLPNINKIASIGGVFVSAGKFIGSVIK